MLQKRKEGFMIKQISKNEICQVCGGQKTNYTTSDNKKSDPFVNAFKCFSYVLGSISVSVTLCRNAFELYNNQAIVNPNAPEPAGIVCLVIGGTSGLAMGVALCLGIE